MKKIFYSVLALAALVACQTLDQEPATAISAETAIESVQDLSYTVNGAYYLATGRGQLSLVSELAIYADELGPDSDVQSGSGQYAQKIHERSITPLDSWNAYASLYRGIAAINKALQKAEALEDQAGAAPYLAELVGMRGLFHFHLATFYAPIPTTGSANTMGVVLSTEVYPLDYKAPRASLEETYKQIVDDLTTYINSGYNKDPYEGHLTYWAALAIRARAYLYWGKYAEALADANKVINEGPFKLYTPENYVKVWETDGGDEVIMEYAQDDTYNAQRYAPGYYTHPDGYTEYLVTEDFYNFMQENPDDVRSQLVGYREGKGPSGPYPLKYPGKAGSAVPLYSHSVKVVRLAEMYLIAAEASYKTSGVAAALPFLNTLRKNRIVGYTDVTEFEGDFIDEILNERRKELFSEGQIAFDFWRNKKSVTSGPITYDPDHYQNVLPIPKDEIDVVGADILKQNPGY